MRRLPGLAEALVLAALSWAGSTHAAEEDPTVPRRIVVGAPRGGAPMHRLDSARSGLSRFLLPREPAVTRRARLSADVAVSIAADDDGRVVLATTDRRLTQLGANFEVDWSLELDAVAAQAPVLSSNGTRVVVTERGSVVGISPRGRELFRTDEASARGPVRAPPLPTRNGAIVVGIGARVTRIGARGALEAAVDTPAAVVALVEFGGEIVVGVESGEVLSWNGARLRKLGDLGGRPSADLVRSGNRRLWGVVQQSMLVGLDVMHGTREAALSVAPDRFSGAPAVTASGELRAVTEGGVLLGYAGDVQNTTVALHTSRTVSAPFVPTGAPLTDREGTVVFLATPVTVGTVLSSGEVRTLVIEGCGALAGAAPLGPGRLAVACRAGLVAELADAPRTPGSPEG